MSLNISKGEPVPPGASARNSPSFFFGSDSTLDALDSLASASHLVLYCGAGVSIDQTSVTWKQLVDQVFKLAKASRNHRRKKESKSVEYLLRHLKDDRQAASILLEEFRADGESDNQFLGTKLKEVLYGNDGWQRGYIMRNLVQLSLAATRHGRKVTIITTNYDVYIEDEFVDRRAKLIAAGLPEEEVGGLSRRLLDNDGAGRLEEVVKAGSRAETVELIYLHGRVDKDGMVEGDIVLTEASYATTRERSGRILRDSFGGAGKGVLVVGASMTDEPLVQALALTKAADGGRFALLAAPSELNDPLIELESEDATTVIDGTSVGKAWQLRGKHLGITQLAPLSHSQSAQFLEELRVCLTAAENTGEAGYYRAEESQIGFPQRLMRWHDAWSNRVDLKDPNFAHGELSDTLKGIQSLLREVAESGETLRVEIWARRGPSSKNRSMTLLAHSTGPIIDESTMRTEAVTSTSTNASVRTLLAGRPLLTRISDMGFAPNASRWQTFLSVPIFVQVPTDVAGTSDVAYVPVGVITLASDKSLGSAEDPSVLSDGLSAKTFTEIKEYLIGTGRIVLRMKA